MSDYIKATNFRIKDTLVTGDPSKRIKGSEIDDEFIAIATAISSKANTASPNLTGTPTAPTASAGENSTQIATTAFVFQNSVPIGAILMWGGLISSLPNGYALCDGTGGTPDLRNRFVIGAGSTYAVGATGGSKDAVVISHTHTLTDPGHKHQVKSIYTSLSSQDSGTVTEAGSGNEAILRDAEMTATTGITINTTGEAGTDKNLPPYYALAFIQRVS
jgi:hypothetical protein